MQSLVATLSLAALVVLFLFPVLLGDSVLFPCDPRTATPWCYHADEVLREDLASEPFNELLTDKIVFDFPKLHLAARLWREEGRAPLWNPYAFSGNRLLASAMPSLLYPGNAIFLVDPYRGFAWSAALHLLLAGLFSYFYLRAVGAGFAGALLGGVGFAFGGWFTARLNLPSCLYAATWLPLLLLAVERRLGGGGPIWLAIVALATALTWTAGFPPVAVLGLYATALYALVRSIAVVRTGGRRRGAMGLAGVAAALVLGTALAAPQIWPTHVAAKYSGRAHQDRTALAEGALRPAALIGAALPDFFGNPVDQSPGAVAGRRDGPLAPRLLGLDGPWDGDTNNYLENAHYPGLVSLLLLLAALGRGRGRRWITGFWILLGVLALLMALAVPPLDAWCARLPGLDIGNVKRSLILVSLSAAMLSGLALDGLLRRRAAGGRGGHAPLAVASLLLALCALLGLVPGLLGRGLGLLADLAPTGAPELTAASIDLWVANTRWCLLRAGMVLVVAIPLLAVLLRGKWPRLAALGLVLVAFVDLAAAGRRFNPNHRADSLAPTPGIAFLVRPDEPPFRIVRFGRLELAHRVLPPNTAAIYGIQDVQGWDVLFPARYQRYLNCIEPSLARRHHLIFPLLRAESLSSPLLHLLGARFVLTHCDWGARPAPGYRRAYPLRADGEIDPVRLAREGLVVYENANALPRAFVARATVVVESEDAAFAAITAAGFDPGRSVVVETAGPALPSVTDPPAIRVASYSARHVEVEVGPGPAAVLVLTDAFDPGWVASLGKDRLEILKADAIFRAVVLPARTAPARVTFHYPGTDFQHGLWVAAAATILLIGAGLLAIRSRRAGRDRTEPGQNRSPNGLDD